MVRRNRNRGKKENKPKFDINVIYQRRIQKQKQQEIRELIMTIKALQILNKDTHDLKDKLNILLKQNFTKS